MREHRTVRDIKKPCIRTIIQAADRSKTHRRDQDGSAPQRVSVKSGDRRVCLKPPASLRVDRSACPRSHTDPLRSQTPLAADQSYFCAGAGAGLAAGALLAGALAAGFFACFFVCFFTGLVVSVEVLLLELSAGFAGVCAANVKGIRARPSTVAIIVFFISFLLSGFLSPVNFILRPIAFFHDSPRRLSRPPKLQDTG